MPGSAAAMAMQQASGNWKLDADDGGGSGLALNSHSRVMLMAKLGETAGSLVIYSFIYLLIYFLLFISVYQCMYVCMCMCFRM